MITVLAFLLTLGVLVVIHEYGHYRMALACGVKVLRFSVGFGKVLYSKKRGADNTEFVVSMLPLGGYVRMLDEREGAVDPAEAHRAFNRKPLWKRAAIVSAGPLANLVLAVFLYAGANWIGIDEPKALIGSPPPASLAEQAGLRSGDWLHSFSADGSNWRDLKSMTDLRWEVTQSMMRSEPLYLAVTDARGRGRHTVVIGLDTLGSKDVDAESMRRIGLTVPYSEPVLGEVTADGPAGRSGLQKGDRVISINGKPVADAASLRERIRTNVAPAAQPPVPAADASAADTNADTNADKNADGSSGRSSAGASDESATKSVAPAAVPTGPAPMLWRIDRAGREVEVTVTPKVVGEGANRVARIEAYIGRPPEMVTVRYGVVDGLVEAVSRTWEVSALTLKMMGRMLTGDVSLKNLSGPLTIADYAGQSVRLGLAYYLGFLALVSVSLGILNLLPLPMLDGGHLMYYLFEAVTGRPVSDVWLERLQRGGVVIMLMMMSLALYNDMARLLGFQ